METTLKSFIVGLVYNSLILSLGFLFFLVFRLKRGDTFQKNLIVSEKEELDESRLTSDGGSKEYGKLPGEEETDKLDSVDEVGDGDNAGGCMDLFFGFFSTLHKIDDKSFKSSDVYFYLLLVRYCAAIFGILSLLGLFVVLPLNIYNFNDRSQGWILRAASGQIATQGTSTWVAFAATIVYSLIVYSFAFDITNRILRHRYKPTRRFPSEQFSLLVRKLRKSDTDNDLFTAFDDMCPGDVIGSNVVFRNIKGSEEVTTPTTPDGDKERRLASSDRTIELEAMLGKAQEERHRLSEDGPPKGGSGADGLEDLEKLEGSVAADENEAETSKALGNFTKLINQARSRVSAAHGESTRIGFVTFNSTDAVDRALNDPRIKQQYPWKMREAPPPNDLIWDNLHVSKRCRRVYGVIMNTLLFLLALFVTSASVFTQWIPTLLESFSEKLKHISIIELSLSGWGSTLVLYLNNSLIIPFLVVTAADYTRYWRVSEKMKAVQFSLSVFLILTCLVFPIIGSSSIGKLLEVFYATDVTQWNTKLGNLIVTQSGTFAVGYVNSACFISSATALIQAPYFLYRYFAGWFGWDASPWLFDFAYNYAFCMSIFTLCIVLSVFIPISLPFAALFFYLKYQIDKYNFIYNINIVQSESEGSVAAFSVRILLFATILLQFCMSGYFINRAIQLQQTDAVDVTLVVGSSLLLLCSILSVVGMTAEITGILRFTESLKMKLLVGRERIASPSEQQWLKIAYLPPQ